ncbi:MAG: PadR family transcriptional regulator [Solirubrobacterales bacterium]|nr:PadR family transcriptional regulator [Solirubrobacterales bacterium]
MELSATAYVILGMVSWRPMSGYDIKQTVDGSTRFFWAASYSQIYAELHRLEQAGLLAAEPQPTGGRRRNLHRLTDDGRRALREWLEREPETFEMRDEALLKLFFASASPESARTTLEAKRRHHRALAERLEGMQRAGKASGYAAIVLGYGVECQRWMESWCERALAELPTGGGDPASDEVAA